MARIEWRRKSPHSNQARKLLVEMAKEERACEAQARDELGAAEFAEFRSYLRAVFRRTRAEVAAAELETKDKVMKWILESATPAPPRQQ